VKEVVEEMEDTQTPGMIHLERFLPVMISVFLNNRYSTADKKHLIPDKFLMRPMTAKRAAVLVFDCYHF
jgi:hypothetical protein